MAIARDFIKVLKENYIVICIYKKITNEERENALRTSQTINAIKTGSSEPNIAAKKWMCEAPFKVKLVKVYSEEAELLQNK